MWNTAATSASVLFMPNSNVMSPRWLMVEYASTPFMSRWKVAAYAPTSSDARPALQTMANQRSVPDNTGHNRASRNTPALTMVAECKYDDTGVGAAIARGNQK